MFYFIYFRRSKRYLELFEDPLSLGDLIESYDRNDPFFDWGLCPLISPDASTMDPFQQNDGVCTESSAQVVDPNFGIEEGEMSIGYIPFPSKIPRTQVQNQNNNRTRVNKNPVVVGNNKYGQKGTLKCDHCRRRRRQVSHEQVIHMLTIKCVYEVVEKPCDYCAERGFDCGAKDKVVGPRRSQQDCETLQAEIVHQFTILEPPSDIVLHPFSSP